MTILYFVIALGLLVTIHEWGHFIVARKCGIRVDEFSIGFGPKIFGFKKGNTEYKFCLLPLGGYVKLFGEDPAGESEGNEARAAEIAKAPDAFSSRPMAARLATVMAGPIMNLVLCLVLMPLVFMIGRMVPAILEEAPVVLGVKADSPAEKIGVLKGDTILEINGQKTATWTDVLNWVVVHPSDAATMIVKRDDKVIPMTFQTINSPFSSQIIGYAGFEPQFFWGNDAVLGTVNANSPAFTAGLKLKDKVTAINGREISTWDEMTEMVRGSDGKPLNLDVVREGQKINVTVTPKFQEEAKAYLMGVMHYNDPSLLIKKRYPPLQAITEGWVEVKKLFGMTVDVLKRLLSFQLSYKALGGPLQIAQATGAAAKSGFSEFLYFVAFLSLQLGVLNLLPIPVLDGGHVLFMTIEAIRRKPLSAKFKNALVMGGLVFLLSLMVLITINDMDRMWGIFSFFSKIKGFF